MDVKVEKNEITITHKLKKGEMYKVQDGVRKSVTIYKKPQIVVGYSNMCEDGKGILLIDYDNVDESVVLEDYRFLQRDYRLPKAYLFTTKPGNYHVVCLEKRTPMKINEILQRTRCDENYKTMPLRSPYRSWVLRISEKNGSNKPKLIGMIGLMYPGRIQSNAHFELLKKFYPKIQRKDHKQLDRNHKIKLQMYETP